MPHDYKILWLYLLDKCSHSGLYQVDIDAMSFNIGKTYKENDILSVFKGRISVVNNEKWLIPNFIKFQYGELEENNRVHFSVIKELKSLGVYKTLISPLKGGKAMVKDKDKNKVKVKEDEMSEKYTHFLNPKFGEAFDSFLEMRASIKAKPTQRAKELILDTLHKHDINTAIKMLEKSIKSSWKDVFPLKDNKDGRFTKAQQRSIQSMNELNDELREKGEL